MVVWWYEILKYFLTLEKFHISSRPYSILFFQLRKLYLLTFLDDTTKHAFSVLGRIITEEITQIYGKNAREFKKLRIQI